MHQQYSSSNLNYTHEADFRQERNFGQKISATFEFIGAHWRPLGRVMLYLVAPLALLQGILAAAVQSRTLGAMLRSSPYAPGHDPLAAQRAMYAAIFQNPLYYVNIVTSMVFLSVLILTVYGYMRCCLRPEGEPTAPIMPAQVWGVVRRHLVGTFFSIWGVTIVIMLGFFVFFFPGMYLSVALSLFFVVRVVEETGFFATISRCLSLTKGKWWSTFGLIFIIIALLYALFFGLMLVISTLRLGLHSTFTPTSQPGELSTIFAIISSALFVVFSFVLYPPILLALAFQYFNLVERRESVGLHHLVGQLGRAPLAAPDGTTYRPHEEGEY